MWRERGLASTSCLTLCWPERARAPLVTSVAGQQRSVLRTASPFFSEPALRRPCRPSTAMFKRGIGFAWPTIVRAMDGPPRRAVAALAYKTHGEPSEVLSQEDYDLPTEIGPEDVKIKMLASPINPADLNTVEGKYPLLPQSLPAVGGHEGVGEIISIGAKVSDLTVGDWVVPLESGLGTWREAGVFKRTAWHKKFAKLHKGDVIVQNGANSTVGQVVIQLAKEMDVKTMNIVRRRQREEDQQATEDHLMSLGATAVATEANAKSVYESCGFPRAALAFDCVGGRSTTSVAKFLREGGTVVTYGAMSLQPVSIPASLLIFRDIRVRGFWWSGRAVQEMGKTGKAAIIDKVVKLVQEGKLKIRTERMPMSRYRHALAMCREGYRGTKILLVQDT